MIGDKSFRPRQDQNGVIYETICNPCNNHLGDKYDHALIDFSHSIETFVKSKLYLPDSFEVECQPNALMRSILGHILAAKTFTDRLSKIDSLIRPCVLDPSIPIPNDIHIFYWLHPYEQSVILRDVGMPDVRDNPWGHEKFTIFNIIKFYPLAFLISHQLPSYDNLPSLHLFNPISFTDRTSVKINLLATRESSFPESLSDGNFLMLGRSEKDSVFSIPKPPSKKAKKAKKSKKSKKNRS